MTRRLFVLLAVLALLSIACGDDSTPVDAGEGPEDTTSTTTTPPPADPASPQERLAAARAMWAENGLASYRLTTQELCFCPETVWIDTVVDGSVTTHESAGDETFYDPGERTMEVLFDEVAAAIDEGYATLDLDFDPDTGALVRFWVDVDEMMADEEHGVEVRSLEPHVEEPVVVPVDAAALTDDYGCGFGFALGSAEQDLALVISATTGFGDGPDVSEPVVFPSADWTAEIRVGSDLFANWCDDVITASEPQSVVDATWTIVAGTLTIDGPVAPGDCAGSIVEATLTDAVAESPDGTSVDLGDIDLVNDTWGCFAG
jgi:hypothetical protein